MATVPASMRALVAPTYCEPSGYEVSEIPVPVLENSTDVLVKVHAAAIKTGDTQFARGAMKMFTEVEFPATLGAQGSGVVVAVGKDVKSLRVGDEVFSLEMIRPFLPWKLIGYCAEYAIVRERLAIKKPNFMTFEEAASLAGDTITIYQCFKRGLEILGVPNKSLQGMTVFVPGALSATGSIGVQMAKIMGAKRVISTVSTAKMPLVEQHLPGVVDQLIDYTAEDVVKKVGKGTVDFILNTQWQLTSTFPLLKKEKAVAISIASVPQSPLLYDLFGKENVPFWLPWVSDLAYLWYRWNLLGKNARTEFISGNPDVPDDLDAIREIIASGKLKPVITVVNLNDIESVRRESQKVRTGKGGFGQLVVKIV